MTSGFEAFYLGRPNRVKWFAGCFAFEPGSVSLLKG